MALITKDQLWQINDTQWEDVPVPEWGAGVEVRLRNLSGEELDAYQAGLVIQTRDGGRKVNLRNASARLLVACAINEDGSPMFEVKDVMRLSQMNAKALNRLTVVAQRLSGMTEDDMKEFTENFDDVQSESSTSG